MGLLATAERHADDGLELENRAAATASAPLRRYLEGVAVAAAARYLREFGSLDAEPDQAILASILYEVRGRLEDAPTDPSLTLSRDVVAAVSLGEGQAAEIVGAGAPLVGGQPPAEVRDDLASLPARTDDRIKAAILSLSPMFVAGYPALVAALARTRPAVTGIEATARWTVNRSRAAGVQAVANSAGVGRVWLPERDACVHCTAYAGEVAPPRGAFPGGLTFGDKPLSRSPLPDPPLHPQCRCSVSPWAAEWAARPGEVDVPDALKREAERSIARGWSLESESEAVRLEAADRLLRRGSRLPPTVQRRAERAVRSGGFRSRSVPQR